MAGLYDGLHEWFISSKWLDGSWIDWYMYCGMMDVTSLDGDVYWTDKKVDGNLLGCAPVFIKFE